MNNRFDPTLEQQLAFMRVLVNTRRRIAPFEWFAVFRRASVLINPELCGDPAPESIDVTNMNRTMYIPGAPFGCVAPKGHYGSHRYGLR